MREPSLEYQIVRPDGGDGDLVVKVEVASADPAVREGARAAAVSGLRETLGVRALVEILDRDTIPRAGYKATRVIDPA
jgi:phenylacetate-coenzyme A ligase PaaK-like adenylate-forming protein